MNACGVCGEDFNSVEAFDRHRVGKHAYLFSIDHLDGRRCLDVEEMRAKGWKLNAQGCWFDPIRVKKGLSALVSSTERR